MTDNVFNFFIIIKSRDQLYPAPFKTPQLAAWVTNIPFSAELNTPWKKGAGFISCQEVNMHAVELQDRGICGRMTKLFRVPDGT